jgi:hypothetical protein
MKVRKVKEQIADSMDADAFENFRSLRTDPFANAVGSDGAVALLEQQET